MADDTTVEVKIIGNLDQSVQSSVNATTSQLKGLGTQAAVSAAQIKSAFGGEVQGADDLVARIESLTAAKAETAVAARTMASAEVSATAAATSLGHGTAGVTREVIVLAHEMVSGNFTRVPGSIMVLTERMGGLSLATLGTYGSVAVFAAGLGYMIYESIEAEIALHKLADGFAMTGRESQFSADYLAYELENLSKLPGVNGAAAQSFLGLIANMADVSVHLEGQVSQLLPAFIEKFGDEGPKAAAKFAGELANLNVNGFRKMNDELLGLQPEQYAHIQNLIETGNTAQAVSAILEQLSKNTGIYIKSTGDKIYDAEQKVKELQAALAQPMGGDDMGEYYGQLIADLEKAQKSVAELKKEQSDDSNKGGATKAIDLADQINNRLTERERLTKEIAALQKGAELNQGNPEALKGINTALSKDVSDAQKIDNEAAFKSFEQTVQQELAAYKSGTSKRIALDQEAADKAKQLLGEQSSEYSKWATAVVQDKRAATDQMAREDSKASQQALESARVSASNIISNDNLTAQQRLAALRTLWAQLLSGGKLNAKQVGEATIESNNEIRAAEKAALREHLNDVQEASQQEIDAEREKSRRIMEAAEQAFKYDQISIQEETAEVQAAENARFSAVAESLQKQRDAAAAMPEALKRIDKEIEDNKRQHEQTMDDITKRSVDQMVAKYRQAYAPITNGFDTMLQNMMGGQMTFLQAIRSGVARMVQDWILANARRLINDRVTQAAMTAATRAGNAARSASDAASHSDFLEDVIEQIAKWLGLETSKTTATTVGNVARTATTTAASIASQEEAVAVAAGLVAVDATVAAAGAYAATAVIPYVGPMLAPGAAATAYGAVMAMESGLTIGSAEGGAYEVGGGFFELHKQEMVLPAHIASRLRNAVDGMSEGNSRSDSRGGSPIVNIKAVDGGSVQRMLKKRTTMRHIAKAFGNYQTLNPSTRGAF